MRVRLIHAHPVEESYSTALRDRAVRTLAAAGHDVEVSRLCAGDDPEPAELATADAVVLVYPTWWGGLPAQLLDWVQRRLGPAIDNGAASPLASVRHLVAVTTHGSSELINRIQGEAGRGLLAGPVAKLCAPGTKLHWIALYKLDRRTEFELSAFIDRVGAELVLPPAKASQPA